jgi:nitrite reductase/ring-hydroxylating ferredoxin subunit
MVNIASRSPYGQNRKAGFENGIPFAQVLDGGMIVGSAGDEDVLLIRRDEEIFAVGAYCTHYHGPLAQGLLVGDTLRCPLHHACFNIRTGQALRAPAFDPIASWRVERIGGTVFVREKVGAPDIGGVQASTDSRRMSRAPGTLRSAVIVGGGVAGLSAADSLRRNGYEADHDQRR